VNYSPWEGPVVWDVTAPRHLAIAGRLDILLEVAGFQATRVVANPADPIEDDLLGVPLELLSELAAAEQYYLTLFRRFGKTTYLNCSLQLQQARHHPDLQILEMNDEEHDAAEVFESWPFAARNGLLAPLGRGEASVLAVTSERGLVAGLEDADARRIAVSYGIQVVTVSDLFQAAIAGLVR
jgi:hypothetical protein